MLNGSALQLIGSLSAGLFFGGIGALKLFGSSDNGKNGNKNGIYVRKEDCRSFQGNFDTRFNEIGDRQSEMMTSIGELRKEFREDLQETNRKIDQILINR
ncbi:MAG: hypothetical protein ACE5GM_10780 [bacterium]